MSELAATARSGAAWASACQDGFGGRGDGHEPAAARCRWIRDSPATPAGRCTRSGRKHPSFIGIVGSAKQRTAYTIPERVCDTDELIEPRAWGDVPARSTSTVPSPDNVTATRTSKVRSSTPSLSMVNVLSYRPGGERGQRVAHPSLGVVERLPHEARDFGRAVPVVQLVDPTGDDVHAGDERLDVADDLVGGAAVPADDPHTTSLAGSPARARWTGGNSSPSTNVSVASDAKPAADTPPTSATWMSVPAKYATRAVGEDRAEHEDVVGVDATPVGVVEGEDVTGRHGPQREVLDEGGE